MDNKMVKKPATIGIIAAVAVVLLIGYFVSRTINQKIGETVVEQTIKAQTGANVNIDSNGEDVTIKTDDGQMQYSAGGDVKLPDGFPRELILAADAKLIMATSSDNGSSVTYLSNDDQTALFDQYIGDLSGLGWKKDVEVNTGQGKMINISKGSETAFITIGDNATKDTSAKTTVNIVWTKDKDK